MKYTSYALIDKSYVSESIRGTYFKQIRDTPVCSNISSIVAQCAMDTLLHTAVSQLNFNLLFISKYINDIITAIPENHHDHILQTFNSQNPPIKFTITHETNFSVQS